MTGLIGVLADSMSSVFVREAYSGMEEGLKDSGYKLQVFEIEGLNLAQRNQVIESLAREKKVDGLVYAHMHLALPLIKAFKDTGIPLGFLAGRMEGVEWTEGDEVGGAYQATKHLLDLGHRRIALISGPLAALESRLREDGFLKALKEAGIEMQRERDIKILNFSEGEGYEAAALLLSLPEPPTAIFVSAGDITALGVMAAAKEWGLHIPRDLSVVGFDDLSFAATLEPPLTTVRQPLRDMGRKIVELVIDAVKNPATHHPSGEVFKTELVVRLSTDSPPGA